MAQSAGKKANGCLIGCLSVIGIIVVTIILIVVFWKLKGDDLIKLALKETKTSMGYLLTEDHTDAEKEEFMEAFGSLLNDFSALGIEGGVQKNQEFFETLRQILEDKRINQHESSEWLENFYSKYKAGQK